MSRLAVQESSIQSAHITPVQILKDLTEYLNRQAGKCIGRPHFRIHISSGRMIIGQAGQWVGRRHFRIHISNGLAGSPGISRCSVNQ